MTYFYSRAEYAQKLIDVINRTEKPFYLYQAKGKGKTTFLKEIQKITSGIYYAFEKDELGDFYQLLDKDILLIDDIQLLGQENLNKLTKLVKDKKCFIAGTTRKIKNEVKIDLPELKEEFVRHCCQVFQTHTSLTLDFEQMWEIFQQESLENFINMLIQMEINHTNVPYVIQDHFETWSNLSPLEKGIVFRVAHKEKLTNREARKWFEQIKLVSANQINYCVKKLKEKNILNKDLTFCDEDFYHFILEEIREFKIEK